MGMTAALMALDAVERLETILAIEVLCACQAIDCDRGDPGKAVAEAYDAVREHVPMLVDDRPPAGDIESVRSLVAGGRVAAILRAALGDGAHEREGVSAA